MKYHLIAIVAIISTYEIYAIEKILNVGLTSTLLQVDSFASGKQSLGPAIEYEMLLNDHFSLGIMTEYSRFAKDNILAKFIYGLTMKHKWAAMNGSSQAIADDYWFLSYGLLFQQLRVSGKSGTAAAHNTRFSFGKRFHQGGIDGILSISYDYSKLNYFDAVPINLDAWSLSYLVPLA